MRNVKPLFLVIVGFLLSAVAFKMALFFYAFPAIPGILSVTFLRDVIIFSVIGLLGTILSAFGIMDMSRGRCHGL